MLLFGTPPSCSVESEKSYNPAQSQFRYCCDYALDYGVNRTSYSACTWSLGIHATDSGNYILRLSPQSFFRPFAVRRSNQFLPIITDFQHLLALSSDNLHCVSTTGIIPLARARILIAFLFGSLLGFEIVSRTHIGSRSGISFPFAKPSFLRTSIILPTYERNK